jgi:MFS family permease
LGARNLRLFAAGQAASLAGTLMQQMAMGWLIYRLTHSAFMLGLVAFLADLPGAAVVLLAGVVLDRVPARSVLLTTQSLAMLQALTLAVLVSAGHANVVVICVLAGLLGLTNGFEVPARQVLAPQLVDRDADLANAIALNSLVYDTARLIGPPLGGIIIAVVGEWFCFLLNGVSYFAVIVALLAMRGLRDVRQPQHQAPLAQLAEGLWYAGSRTTIRRVLLLVGAVCFAAAPYATLLPAMAVSVLQSGSHTLGVLMAAMAAGSLAGAFYFGRRGGEVRLDRLAAMTGALFGLCLAVFGLSRWLLLSSGVLMVGGFGVMLFMASCNTLLVTEADPAYRGRVMSLFTISFMGTVPLGALVTGIVAHRIGPSFTLAIGGGICILAALTFFVRSFPGGAAGGRSIDTEEWTAS